jgi:hypothetical protein
MANEAGPSDFWLRFGSVTGVLQTCSFAKASPKVKTPSSEWLQYFLNRSIDSERVCLLLAPSQRQKMERGVYAASMFASNKDPKYLQAFLCRPR